MRRGGVPVCALSAEQFPVPASKFFSVSPHNQLAQQPELHLEQLLLLLLLRAAAATAAIAATSCCGHPAPLQRSALSQLTLW